MAGSSPKFFPHTRQQALGVSKGTNRLSSTDVAPLSPASRTSRTLNQIVLAGATLALPVTGNTFYLSVATGPLNIRPGNGVSNPYSAGTGLELDLTNTFTLLEIENPNAYAVVFQIFVGFDGYIDKRLYLDNDLTPQVTFPTYPTPNAATAVAIDDLSGGEFTDINGGQWYALNRVSFTISNTDTGVTLLIQEEGATTASGPSIGAVYPATAVRYETSGNFSLSTGGGTINAVVSEVYRALPKTTI